MTRRAILLTALYAFFIGLSSPGTARATFMERDAESVLTFAIEGITLAMTPAEARETAENAGYELFQALGADQANPFGWRYIKGQSTLELEQKTGILTKISLEVFPGSEPVDAQGEIERMQRHFGAAAGEQWCWRNDQGGVCAVKSHPEGKFTATMKAAAFGLSAALHRLLRN